MSELVREIVEVNAAIDGDEVTPLLIVEVEGLAPTLGWTNVRLDPHVYITQTADGLKVFDLFGDPPAPGPSAAADAQTTGEGGWEGPRQEGGIGGPTHATQPT